MPHGWPFSARWRGWPRKCAGPDAPRLLTSLTESFADRTPIDWRRLLARVGPGGDRAFVENLRFVDLLRRSARSGVAAEREPSPLVWLVVVLALVHTVTSMAIVLVSGAHPSAPPLHAVQRALASTFTAAGLVLGTTAARDSRRVLLLATFTCAASAFARAALAGADAGPFGGMLRSLWLEVFTPACLWQFAADFPRVTRFTRFDVIARRIAGGAWICGALVFSLNAGVLVGLFDEASVAALLPNHKSNLFWRWFTLAVLLAVAAILLRAGRAAAGERRRVHRLAWALAAGTAPFLALGLFRSLLPRLDHWLLTAAPADRFWLDVAVAGPLAAMPLLAAAAVIADRPFERQAPIERFLRPRLRFGARDRRLTALAEVTALIRAARGRREICGVLAGFVEQQLMVEDVRVLVTDLDEQFTDAFGRTSLPANTSLAVMLRDASHPVALHPHGRASRLLPQVDRDWLAANGFELLAPIQRRDGKLVAIVACGAAIGRSRFARRDLALLAAALAAAAAAWDAFLSIPERDEAACECPRCGAVADSGDLACGCGARAKAAALPRCFDSRYLVRRRIGAGAMGVVYLARDLTTPRDVALKTIPRLHPGLAVRLRQEARAMAALRHQGLASIHAVGAWRETPVLVLEYFPQGTLARRLQRGPLDPAEASLLARRLADALAYMHETGIRHGDLKPANIALEADNRPRLLDFGLSALNDAWPAGRLSGTVAYLPPEAFRGALPGPSFDLWALAVVIVEALTGSHPFAARSSRRVIRRIVRGKAAEIVSKVPMRPRRLRDVLARALDSSPDRRFQSARELRDVLDSVIAPCAGTPPG